MWHLWTWFSGGLGSVRFMVGLDDLKGLFQPKWLYDSWNHPLKGNIQQGQGGCFIWFVSLDSWDEVTTLKQWNYEREITGCDKEFWDGSQLKSWDELMETGLCVATPVTRSTITQHVQNWIRSYVLKVLQKTLLHHHGLVLDNLHCIPVSGNSNPTIILCAELSVRNSG